MRTCPAAGDAADYYGEKFRGIFKGSPTYTGTQQPLMSKSDHEQG